MKQMTALLVGGLALIGACTKPAVEDNDNSLPHINNVVLKGDSIYIQGRFGPDPGVALRHVIINDLPVPAERTGTWKEEEIIVKAEKEKPQEDEQQKVEVETQVEGKKKKSNAKVVTVPVIPVTHLVDVTFLQMKEPTSYLHIHGNFGTDPGPNRRSIRIEQFTNRAVVTPITKILSWQPNLIVCEIPERGDGSCGKVIVKVDGDSSYRYLYLYEGILSYKRPQDGGSGSLAEYVQFDIRIRGDGEPPSGHVDLTDHQTNLHAVSVARWEGSGEGSSQYNTKEDGCAAIKVQWTKATGTMSATLNNHAANGNFWKAFVKHQRNGFDVKIRFNAINVIRSKVTTTPCNEPAFSEDRIESIYFAEFEEKVIPLRFDKGKIVAGALEKTGLVSSAGFQWEAIDFPNHFMTGYIVWPRIGGLLEEL